MLRSANAFESKGKFILSPEGLEKLAGIFREIKQKLFATTYPESEELEPATPSRQPGGPVRSSQDAGAVRCADSQDGNDWDGE